MGDVDVDVLRDDGDRALAAGAIGEPAQVYRRTRLPPMAEDETRSRDEHEEQLRSPLRAA